MTPHTKEEPRWGLWVTLKTIRIPKHPGTPPKKIISPNESIVDSTIVQQSDI